MPCSLATPQQCCLDNHPQAQHKAQITTLAILQASQGTLHLAEAGQVGIPLPCGYSVFWIKKARASPSVLWQKLRSSNLIYE